MEITLGLWTIIIVGVVIFLIGAVVGYRLARRRKTTVVRKELASERAELRGFRIAQDVREQELDKRESAQYERKLELDQREEELEERDRSLGNQEVILSMAVPGVA